MPRPRYPGAVTTEKFGVELREWVTANLRAFSRREIPLDGRRPAAVALALVADDEGRCCFVLTRRATRLRTHSGQFALPGGRIEAGESSDAAALRELQEEVGLELPPASVLGSLDDFATRSGFVITPVVVWCGDQHELRPDPAEVAIAYRVPLSELGRPGVPVLRAIPESDRPVLSLPLVGTLVHSPTAAIIYQLFEVGIHGRDTRVAHYEQPVFAWS